MPFWLHKRPQDRTLHACMYRHVRRLGWLALDDETDDMGEPVFEDAGNGRAYEVASHYFAMSLSTRPATAPLRKADDTNTDINTDTREAA